MLPCGVSAEKSYIARKTYIIRFFIRAGRYTYFFIKLIKNLRSTKYINCKELCQKLFLELHFIRFKIVKNVTGKLVLYVL